MSGAGWPAPAKLNLFLHVLGRRADGYHLLQTAFQFIDLCDELDFTARSDGRIVRHSECHEIPEAADLAVRAAGALRAAAGVGAGADIRIRKRIPIGGGLGGGSSDAATALVALNALWGAGMPEPELLRIGLTLGADVPVFIAGHAAWAEGVGEHLTPIDPPEEWALVVHPGVHVSTARVFQHPELTRNTPAITIRAFLEGGGANDCEAVVRKMHPEVGAALDWLRRYGEARLTGTGACVFLRCDSAGKAEQVRDDLPAHLSGFVVRGCNRSPLRDRLNRFRA
ncbi:MAG: 4-(cytidine 5'-diphospho)-2-C-methyl-D-erythritol kinase [Gammaproteobacteria bacterium]|nr:4-(cytidine 5'-diphospho)-2-C-methyl-D-erythritol kinase [Gammaproteobacteria bacterium]